MHIYGRWQSPGGTQVYQGDGHIVGPLAGAAGEKATSGSSGTRWVEEGSGPRGTTRSLLFGLSQEESRGRGTWVRGCCVVCFPAQTVFDTFFLGDPYIKTTKRTPQGGCSTVILQ